MKSKFWGLLTIVIIAVFLFSACIPVTQTPFTQGSPVATGTQSAQVTITIWHQWTNDYLGSIQLVLNQYMAEHPNVSIVLMQPDNLKDALKVAIPVIEGPDIIDWTNDQIGSQAQVGNIIDLGTLGVTHDFLKSTYEPAAASGVIWRDKIWALPESQNGIAIVYNKALVSENDFPTDPLDFEGLLAKAKTYIETNPGKYLLCNPGLGNPDAYYEAPIYFGFGVPGYVDDLGKVYLNTPEGIAAGNWINEFKQYAPAKTSEDICTNIFITGTAAAEWIGPGTIESLDTAGIDYGILPMGRPFVSIRSLMISRNAVDRGSTEIALDIIKYLTNQANEVQIALANQTIPANTAALNDPQIQGKATIKGFGDALHSGAPMASTPYAAAQWSSVGEATQAIWNGSQSVEDALTAAQTAIENAITGMK